METQLRPGALQTQLVNAPNTAARAGRPPAPSFHRVEIVQRGPRHYWLVWLIVALGLAAQLVMAWKLLQIESEISEDAKVDAISLAELRGLGVRLREIEGRRERAEQDRLATLRADLEGLRHEVASVKMVVQRPSVIAYPVPASPAPASILVDAPPMLAGPPAEPIDLAGSLAPLPAVESQLALPAEPIERKGSGWAKRSLAGGLLVSSAFLPASTPLTFAQSRPVQRTVKKALGFNSKARNVADDVLDAAADAKISQESRTLRRRRQRRDNFFEGLLKFFMPGLE